MASASAYGVPTGGAGQSAVVTQAQLPQGQQAALVAAQGLAAAAAVQQQQQNGVMHMPYPPNGHAATVQQFQVNGQPTAAV